MRKVRCLPLRRRLDVARGVFFLALEAMRAIGDDHSICEFDPWQTLGQWSERSVEEWTRCRCGSEESAAWTFWILFG